MKLKTLKDLKYHSRDEIKRKDFIGIALNSRTKEASKKGYTVKVDINPNFIYLGTLRDEAIKWVKIGKQIKNKQDRAINNFIVHFFNITEEDFK